jgi:hypothetical protein
VCCTWPRRDGHQRRAGRHPRAPRERAARGGHPARVKGGEEAGADAERGGAASPAAALTRTASRRRPEEIVAEAERLAGRLDDLERTRTELELEQRRLAPFGLFDPAALRRLRRTGWRSGSRGRR